LLGPRQITIAKDEAKNPRSIVPAFLVKKESAACHHWQAPSPHEHAFDANFEIKSQSDNFSCSAASFAEAQA
jgi:hypothetical protein